MSGDLISRSRLMEEIRGLRVKVTGLRAGKGILSEFEKEYRKSILKVIDNQPTAYDVDKVVEQLEELKNESNMLTAKCSVNIIAVDALRKAIEIVKAGGVE